jgi:hypothetical protein
MPSISPTEVKTMRRLEDLIENVLRRSTTLTPTQRVQTTAKLIDQFAHDGITLLLPEAAADDST